MSKDVDIEQFVKDPSLLVELYQKVIDRMNAGFNNAEFREKEAQLREISRTVERLERAGIKVPEALRAEKTRLAAALDAQPGASQALNLLIENLEKILKDLKACVRLGRKPGGSRGRGRRTSNLPRTKEKVLREHIIRALKKSGGKARAPEVIVEIGRQLEGKFLPGDLEGDPLHTYVWRQNVHWARLTMVHDGLLRKDSPRGYWELNEEHQ